MPIRNKNAQGASNAGPSVTRTFTPTEIGNLIVVWGSNNNFDPNTISDTGSHNWVILNPDFNDAVSTRAQTWWTRAKSLAQITITITGGGTFTNCLANEFAGVDLDNPIGEITSSFGSGTPTAGPIILRYSNMAIWAAGNDAITAAGAGYTISADDGASDRSEFQIFVGQSGSSQTVTFTGSGQYAMAVASLVEASPAIYSTRGGRRKRVYN